MRKSVIILDVDLHCNTTVILMGFEKGCGRNGEELVGDGSSEIIEI